MEDKLEEIKSRIVNDWKYIDTPPEWYELIIECHEKLLAIDPDYKLHQVKEKFGGLRYYFDTDTDKEEEMRAIALDCESRSYHIPYK